MVRRQSQVLAGSTISMLVVLAAVSYAALAPDHDALTTPPLWLVAVQLVAGAGVHVLLDAVGYRTRAVPPATPAEEAQRAGVAAYTQRAVLRLALSELVGLLSLAYVFGFGADEWLGYLTGAAVSIVLVLVHVWPWARPVDRTRASLEREGAQVPLREAFGLEPKLTGPIQEL